MFLKVHIEKGMADGQKVVFSGESDQEPRKETGDVVFVLDEEEHPRFKRNGSDLIMEMVKGTLSPPQSSPIKL